MSLTPPGDSHARSAAPELRCSSCGTTLPPDATYCLRCGARAPGASATEPADPLLAALTRVLGSQYEIVRLLGRGGMGVVYLARERALDRLVAIKVLPPEAGEAGSIERFRREARTAAKLTHPGIVPLHSFGEAEGLLYFVMGFVHGEPLSARLRRRGRLDAEEAREILAGVADALQYAHGRAVIHRDIKPDNILIEDETGRAVLTDFGIAKSAATATTLTELGTTLGTPHYMSPEQAAGEQVVDGRSDLYSLGVVGYQMLAGRLPFEGETARDLMVQHITQEPPPLRALAPTAPDDLVDAISTLLTKDPARRTPDARTLTLTLRSGEQWDEQLPEELADFLSDMRPTPWLVAGTMYVGYGCALFGEWAWAAGWAALAGLFGMVVPYTRRARHLQRYHWRAILPRLLRKPSWWPGWWPRRWRPANDVWDRMPEPLRGLERLHLPLWGMTALALPYLARLMIEPTGPLVQFSWLVTTPIIATLGVWFWRGFQFQRWGRRAGLSARDISTLMGAGHGTSLWQKPQIRKLLLPAGSTPDPAATRRPETPAAMVDALITAARVLDGPPGQLAREAAAAGREVLDAIEMLDRQIEALAGDADPIERGRLEEKVKALGAASDTETDARRRMRQLLQEQLELAWGLARQLDATQERRDRLAELLHTLWLQIANLGAQQRGDAVDSVAVTGRIRAITRDAQRYIEASAEATRLLHGD